MRAFCTPRRAALGFVILAVAVVLYAGRTTQAQSRPVDAPAPDLAQRVAHLEKILGVSARTAAGGPSSSRLDRIETLLSRERVGDLDDAATTSLELSLREARSRIERQEREISSLRRELEDVTIELRDLAGGSHLSRSVDRDSVSDVRRFAEGLQRELDMLENRFDRMENRSPAGGDDARRIAESAQRDVDRLRDSLYRIESRISRLERP